MTKNEQIKVQKGFTLLEILLVVAIIAILAGIVIIAINPGKQLADARNSQRKVDVNTILSAAYQYAIDNSGNLPSGVVQNTVTCDSTILTTAPTLEICKTGAASCTNLADLSALTTNQKYIVSLPMDPANPSTDTNGTGYFIEKNTNGRLTVCAPRAEENIQVTVTR